MERVGGLGGVIGHPTLAAPQEKFMLMSRLHGSLLFYSVRTPDIYDIEVPSNSYNPVHNPDLSWHRCIFAEKLNAIPYQDSVPCKQNLQMVSVHYLALTISRIHRVLSPHSIHGLYLPFRYVTVSHKHCP